MSLKEEFQNLIEIQSLENTIKKHLDVIQENNQRVENLIQQVNQRREQIRQEVDLLEEKKRILSSKEKDLFEIESKIEHSNQHLSTVTSEQQLNAINNELATLIPKKDELEECVFLLMEEIESLSLMVEENSNYEKGSQKSIEVTKNEVNELNIERQNQIDNLEQRIAMLLESLDSKIKTQFLELNKKFKYNYPLSNLKGDNCVRCFYTLNKKDGNEIELGELVKLCPSCKRIMIPTCALRS